ncbi:uncharacterized protein LOC135957667 [Calliphora vicina]|uniref:uncharacterized protein LOC135957667 n=1 Tax=Calliphora vicina TaxID=7373 RepID=UPI00325ACC05
MTLSYENMNEECLIPEIFLKEAYTPFMQKVKVFLKEHYALKYNIELHALYAKPNLDDLENTPLEVKTFQTKMEEILNISDFESTFSNKIMNIRKKSEEFQEKDSGWTLVQLIKVYLNLNKYQPLKGSSYIELPKKLHLKYACINVKNADEFCFKWAIISAIADFKKDAGRPSKYNVNIEAENITVKGNSLNFKGLCFPLKVKDISIFEINNPNISINVFGYDESIKLIVGPYYKSKVKRSKHINLLFLQKNIAHNTICHYIWIKNISRLIRSQQTKHESKIFVCDDCLQHFHHQDKLDLHQKICSQLVFRVPTPDKSILEFKNYKNKFDVPFVIYADSECIFENIQTCIPNGNKSSTTLVDRHIPYAFSYFIKSNINNNDLSHKLRHFKGIDAAKLFVETLVADVKSLNDHYLKEIIPMTPLTEQENLDYALNDICHICFKPIANEIKVRDHCHLSGKYRGPAHNSCNLNAKTPKLFPVIFHNFSSYDCHLFVKELNNIDDGPINIIPLNKELYISLSKTIKSDKGNNIEIRFLDSYRFMPSSLDSLIQNLTKDELKIVKEFYSDDENQFNLLIRKGVFPYNYLNSLEKLKETCLPSIDDFYNKLTDSKCSIEDYTHAQEVWSKFECKTLEDYLMVYLKSDVLLLADVFENFRSVCKSIYKLDPCHYYTAPGLSWDAMLKITEIKLDLLTDIEMIRFLQKGIRGGIVQCSQRYSSANNKYLSDYDEKLPSKYLTYLDANNLYGWAMSEALPEGKFEWLTDIDNFSLETIPTDSDIGYILEVDLIYPKEIHDYHNDLPFCCENKTPPNSNEKKLLIDLNDKCEYVIYYKNLQQCLKHGLKLSKIHRILKFKQSNWLQKYISLNNLHRTNAKNTFEKNFFKLLNNAVYGKTMENVDKRKNIKIVNAWESDGKRPGARAMIAKPEFHSYSIFDENMIAIQLNRTFSYYNKPIYLGFTILELSKWKMYDFHYDYILPKYKSKVQLNYMDTDSFIYTIQTDDFYNDILNDIDTRFDTSEYEINNQFGIPQKNKKVLGMMKDENNGILMKEFVGLRAKMYSFKTEDLKETKKAKGVKRNVSNKLSLSDYKDCLLNHKIYYANMHVFKSILHDLYTEYKTKVSLSFLDNKRFICNDKVIP